MDLIIKKFDVGILIAAIILILAKVFNFIDSTTLVGLPAIIFAYYTYKINKRQVNYIIRQHYEEHMRDFFDLWAKYKNSFPVPKNAELFKICNDQIEDEKFEILKNSLLILDIRAQKFKSKEISKAMKHYWDKFRESEGAIIYYIHSKIELDNIDENYPTTESKQKKEDNIMNKNKQNQILVKNTNCFLNDGLIEMNNAYNEAIRKLQ